MVALSTKADTEKCKPLLATMCRQQLFTPRAKTFPIFPQSLGNVSGVRSRNLRRTDMNLQQERRLLIRTEMLNLLQLSEAQLQQLIDTRQVLPIRITREERFDSKELNKLIDSYKRTAERRVA